MKLLLNALVPLFLLMLFSSCESTGKPPSGSSKPNVNNEIMQDDAEGVNDDELGEETVPTEIERKF